MLSLNTIRHRIQCKAHALKHYLGSQPKLIIYISCEQFHAILKDVEWDSLEGFKDGTLEGYPMIVVNDPRHPPFAVGQSSDGSE